MDIYSALLPHPIHIVQATDNIGPCERTFFRLIFKKVNDVLECHCIDRLHINNGNGMSVLITISQTYLPQIVGPYLSVSTMRHK